MKSASRSVYLVLAAAAAVTLASTALHAAGKDGAPRHDLTIFEDEAAGAFRFMIDGNEVARMDRGGFVVMGDIAYSGAAVDIGVPEGTNPDGTAKPR